MKKRISVFLFAVLLLGLAVGLSSCGTSTYERILALPEEERAEALFHAEACLPDPTHTPFSSEMTAATVRTLPNGTRKAHSVTLYTAFTREDGKMAVLNKTFVYEDTSEDGSGSGSREGTATFEGYRDGKMFIGYREEGESADVYWSPISERDYMAYIDGGKRFFEEEEGPTLDGFDFADCTDVTCEADPEKRTLRLNIGGLKSAALDGFYKELLSGNGYFSRSDIENVTISLLFNEHMHPLEMLVEFRFKEDIEKSYRIFSKYDYKKPQFSENVEFLPENETGDLRVIAEAKNALATICEKDSGYVRVKANSNTRGAVTEEIRVYNYEGLHTSPLTYMLDLTPSGGEPHAVITYANGIEKTMKDGKVDPILNAKSEEKARAELLSMLDAGELANARVATVQEQDTKHGDRRYRLRLYDPDDAAFRAAAKTLGGEVVSFRVDIYVTFIGDSLTEVYYELHCGIRLKASSLTVNTDVTVEVDYIKEEE